MKQKCLKEDRLPSKLPVVLSKNINTQITAIESYNHNNVDGLSQLHEYLNVLRNYISNPSIAMDYANRYHCTKNGAIYMSELGFNVLFMVMTNNRTQQAYVYIIKLKLNPEEFGLKVPPTLNENKQHTSTKIVYRMKESQLRRLIQESIKKVLSII